MVRPLHYAEYIGPTDNSVYSYHDFCPACLQEVEGHAARRTPADLEADNLKSFATFDLSSTEYLWARFCQWCGVSFDDEWWVRNPIQNARVVDHFAPGMHTGDEHVFENVEPGGHYLATSGDVMCWCEPIVERTIVGCTIRHQDRVASR